MAIYQHRSLDLGPFCIQSRLTPRDVMSLPLNWFHYPEFLAPTWLLEAESFKSNVTTTMMSVDTHTRSHGHFHVNLG